MPNRWFTVRKRREGWGIYSQHTGEPIRVNGRMQTGLSRETAIQLADLLKALAFIEAELRNRPVTDPNTLH